MIRLVAALASNYRASVIDGFLSIAAVPRHRCSIGVECVPLVPGKRSVFLLGTRVIARCLLFRSANLANLIDEFLGRDLPALLVLTAWAELQRIPGFPAPHVLDTVVFPRKNRARRQYHRIRFSSISSNHFAQMHSWELAIKWVTPSRMSCTRLDRRFARYSIVG
jgi:hypothetical protein